MTAPTSSSGPLLVCFQFVTKGGAVIDTEPEEWPSIKVATERAKEWMELKGQTISFVTFDGDGAVVRTDDIEHTAAMPAAKMAALYEAAKLEAQKEGIIPHE